MKRLQTVGEIVVSCCTTRPLCFGEVKLTIE